MYEIDAPAADLMLDARLEVLEGELATLCFWSAATFIVKQITHDDAHGRAFYQLTAQRFPGLTQIWPGRVEDYNQVLGPPDFWDGLGRIVATKSHPAAAAAAGLPEVAHAFGQQARAVRYDVGPLWDDYPFQQLPIKRRGD